MFPNTTAVISADLWTARYSRSHHQKGSHSLSAADDIRDDLGNFQIGGVEQVAVRELGDEVDGIIEVCQD